MSDPRLLICLPWKASRYIPSIARKCGCGKVCQVDATNAEALDRGEFKVICAECAIKDPRFYAELTDGIGVVHCGRTITLRAKEKP